MLLELELKSPPGQHLFLLETSRTPRQTRVVVASVVGADGPQLDKAGLLGIVGAPEELDLREGQCGRFHAQRAENMFQVCEVGLGSGALDGSDMSRMRIVLGNIDDLFVLRW